MNQAKNGSRWIETTLIMVAAAALVSVAFANVIRVKVSPEAGLMARAILFGAGWIAAIGWAVAAGKRAVLLWLGVLAACGVLIAVCQAFAGGVSGSMLLQLIGPGGAGVGVALIITRCLETNAARTAWIAAALGFVAATWLALEPEMELWKLLPNDWEVSKGLEYRWGIRMGEERARFLFETPMEAGIVQWFLGSLCLATAMSSGGGRTVAVLFGTVALILYGSVALTYSRAGIVLGIMSISLAVLMSIRSRRTTIIVCILGVLIVPFAALVADRVGAEGSAVLRNLTSILDPAEEANRIRLNQFAQVGRDLSETPWQGLGAESFATFEDAPRMPQHESSPIGLITAFGVGGAALALAFVWHLLRRFRSIVEIVDGKPHARPGAAACLMVLTAVPFAVYSLVAPILAGVTFGMMCFTIMGMLATWSEPPRKGAGKP